MAYTGNTGKVEIDTVEYPVTSWSFDEGINPIDVTHISDPAEEARRFISDGLRNATGSGVFDVTDTIAPPRATIGDPVDFELQDEHYTYAPADHAGDADGIFITNVSTPRAIGEKVVCSFDFQISGPVLIT
jgi:hypothetical protein